MKRVTNAPSSGRPVFATNSAVAVCCTEIGTPLGLSSVFPIMPDIARRMASAKPMPVKRFQRGSLFKRDRSVIGFVDSCSEEMNCSDTLLGESLFITVFSFSSLIPAHKLIGCAWCRVGLTVVSIPNSRVPRLGGNRDNF